MTPYEFCRDLRTQKTRVAGLSCGGVVCAILRLAVSVEHRLVRDRQAHDYGVYGASMASRGKNRQSPSHSGTTYADFIHDVKHSGTPYKTRLVQMLRVCSSGELRDVVALRQLRSHTVKTGRSDGVVVRRPCEAVRGR